MLFIASASALWLPGLTRRCRYPRGIKGLNSSFAGSTSGNVDRVSPGVMAGDRAAGCRTLINQLRVFLIAVLPPALYRLLQRAHHVQGRGIRSSPRGR